MNSLHSAGAGLAPLRPGSIVARWKRTLRINRSLLRFVIAAAIATLAYNFLWDNAKSGLSDVDLALGSSAGHGHVRDPVAAAEAKRAREAEEQRIAAERENRLSGEAARIRAELDKAPSLVWDKTFDEWNASAGAVTMNLKWQNDRLPDELNSNRVYFLNIRANGVFSAQLRSSKAIIPVYVRPNENEASRVYLADSADPITWQRDADSDMGGYLANRWGGKLSEDRPPNADPSQASGAPLYSQGRINRGKGPGDLPYSPSLEVPKDMGFEVPFQEPPTDEIRLWELAFIVPAVDATEPFELTIRNVEPLSSIPEPWLCSMGISYKDEELPSYVEKSDLLWDIRQFCGANKTRKEYLTKGNRFPGRPNNTPYNASFVYRQQLRFSHETVPAATYARELRDSLDTLFLFVYGRNPSFKPPGNFYKAPKDFLALGRWLKNSAPINMTVGNPDIHPNRTVCPLLYFKDNRSELCENPNKEEYRFLPFAVPFRQQMIYPRWLMQQCNWNSQPLIMGDSLASSLSNAMSCHMKLASGMGEMFLGNIANTQAWPVKLFHPLFPDRGGKLPTYDEYLYYRNALGWDRKVKIALWQIGVWPTSYSDSTRWYRGLDLLGSFLARDREEYNITGFMATVTPPQTLIVDGGWLKGPGYQTRGRAHKWNWILRKVMAKWDVPVVDTWSPLEPRFDERTDNAHYCHGAMYELALVTTPRICPQ